MSRQVSQDRPVTDTVVPGDQIIRDFSIIPFEKDLDSTGRKEVLQWLEEREDRYVGLLGDSGIGKTHVALQYAHHVQQRFPEIYIFCVDARSRTTLEQSYQDFAARLQLVGYSSLDHSAYKVVHDWLCDDKNGPWLMFVDDIHWDVLCPNNENDQTGCEPLKSFLPERGQGSVIFTSRDRRVATQLAPTNAIYSMKIPGKDEAFALLQKKLGNNVKEEKAAMLALVEALAYSPLAICQAAANMTRQSPRTSVSTYLSQFTNTLESLDLEHRDPSICIENPIKTASHITSRQNCLKRNTVADALLFMSFFDPQDIPTSALQSYAHDVLGKTRSAQLSPHILHEYLAPSKIREPEMFKTYPYLQIYTQKWLLSSSETQCWIWGLFAAAPEAHDHLSTITSKLEILEEDEPPNTSDFLTWSKAQSNLAIFHILLGNHSRASWIAERVVGADVRKLGSGHTETLRNMDNFAFVLRRQGRLQQAEEYNRQAFELREEQFGPESPDVSQSISPVAWALQDQGGWEEAETLHWQLLSSQIQLFDKDHPYIAASLNNLVLDLRQQKKHEEAYAITKIFFENGLNIESIDRCVQIVLSWATAKGWEHNMRLLLDVVANLKADNETECSAKASCSPDDYDSEHSDNDSVFSIPHSLSSITTLGTNAGEINLLLVQQLSSLLYRDDALISLIGTAVSEERIGYERMRNNFRKLLKHYAKDLKAEVTTDQHQNLVGFVSAYSAHITRELFSMSPLVNRNRVFTQLAEFNGDSNSRNECLRKVEDYLSSVDKAKSTDPEMETDNSSDEDCMDAEDDEYAQYDGSLENLNLMENFVLESAAYQTLRRRLHDFVYPSLWSRLRDLLTSWSDPGHEHHAYVTQYKLRNLAAELRQVEPQAIRISRAEQYHLFSHQGIGMLQNLVERWSGERWDWWPLPSCPRRLQGYEALVQWKCTCGESRWAEVPLPFARHLKSIIRTLKSSLTAEEQPNVSSTLPVYTIPVVNESKAAPKQTTAGGQMSGYPASSRSTLNTQPGSSYVHPQKSYQAVNNRVLFLVNQRGSHMLTQIDTGGLDSQSFFNTLRNEYFRLRGILGSWFSIWRYSHCDFYMCEKFDDHEFAPTRKDVFPEVTNPDYEYLPKPMESIPPICEHEFEKRFYACYQPSPLLHWYHRCRGAKGHSYDLLNLLPKKKSDFEEGGDKRERFWDIYAGEKISLRWVLLYNFICLLPMGIFFVVWIVPLRRTTDLQSAAVPLSIMIALQSLFWSLFLSSLHFGKSIS